MDDITMLKDLKSRCPTEETILRDILHPADKGADWLGHETYEWYYVLGQYFQPKRLIEIGTRFGYSLTAMCLGSNQKGIEVWSYDSERDCGGSCEYVANHYRQAKENNTLDVRFNYTVVDTRNLKRLGLPDKVDLAHVDGDHSPRGCCEDACLVREWVRPGGVILIDDVKEGGVRFGADVFCERYKLTPQFLDCFRGLYVIRV